MFGFCFGGWDAYQAVHEALLVIPSDAVGGDGFDVGEIAQRAAAERGIDPDAFVFVEADGRLGERVIVGLTDASDRGPKP